MKGDLKPEVTFKRLLNKLDKLIKKNTENAKLFEDKEMWLSCEKSKSAARAYENIKNFITNGSSTNY